MSWQDWATIASLLVSIVGVAITVWQLVLTRRSSTAAQIAAKGARDDVAALKRVIETEQLLTKLRVLLEHLKLDRFAAAADAVLDLHELLARSFADKQDGETTRLLSDFRAFHETLSDAAEIARIDKDQKHMITRSTLALQAHILRNGNGAALALVDRNGAK